MNEESKKIWKKSPNWFQAWLILTGATTVIFLTIAGVTNNLPGVSWLWFPAIVIATIYSAIIAAAIVGLGVFIRWICRGRNFKKFIFGSACLATLIALFYAEEDWRGTHDWENYKRAAEAKGEKLDFKDFVPSPVPDDQNFAFTPIVASSYAAMLDKSGHEIKPRNTNVVNRLLQMDLGADNHYGDWPSDRGDWVTAKTMDLKSWQNYYRALAAKTNFFPVAPQPQTPAQDVLLALSKYDSAIEELRAAGKLPDSRFPLEYDKDDPAEILLPHLAALKRASLVLQLRAVAELQNGQTEKAFDDVKLMLRLADSIKTEPFIITHLVRFAIVNLALQPIYEGLAERKWSDAQLADLDSELSKLDFLANYEFSVSGERAYHTKIVDWLEQKRSRYWDFFNMISGDQQNTKNTFWGTVALYLAPKGWFQQNKIVMAQFQQEWDLPLVDDAQQIISPKMVAQTKRAAEAASPLTPFNFFARLLVPELGGYAEKTAYAQTSVNLARVALALERYKIAHENFPDSLDALAPQFLGKIPHDIIDGQSLKYRRTDDGQFVLYSIGWDETDDGGVVVFKKNSTTNVDRDQGDWVWRYPQK